jgi:hypothetical protein
MQLAVLPQVHLSLHTFFRQLETASAKARVAPPRPFLHSVQAWSPWWNGTCDLARFAPAQPASAHSAAAAAAAGPSASLSCAVPPLQKPAYLEYALSQLGVGFQHGVEFHGFIAYRLPARYDREWGSCSLPLTSLALYHSSAWIFSFWAAVGEADGCCVLLSLCLSVQLLSLTILPSFFVPSCIKHVGDI